MQVITAVRKQNGHFNRSSSNTEALLKQTFGGRPALKPVKEVATRWNSTLLALMRYYSTAPHHRQYHAEKNKSLRGSAARNAKNPVTADLCTIVGQVASIGAHVLDCTSKCEGNKSLLLTGK